MPIPLISWSVSEVIDLRYAVFAILAARRGELNLEDGDEEELLAGILEKIDQGLDLYYGAVQEPSRRQSEGV